MPYLLPTIRQGVSTGWEVRLLAPNHVDLWLPNKTKAGNALIILGATNHNATSVDVADEKSNSWQTAVCYAYGGYAALWCHYALNIAEGTQHITLDISPTGENVSHDQWIILEVANISAYRESATGLSSGSTVSTGSSLGQSGDFILHCGRPQQTAGAPPTALTKGKGFTALSSRLTDAGPDALPAAHFLQSKVATGATAPSFTYSGKTQDWQSLAVAFVVSSKPQGDGTLDTRNGPRVKWITHRDLYTEAANTEQIVVHGDTLVLCDGQTNNANPFVHLSSISDTAGNTWTSEVSDVSCSAGTSDVFVAQNVVADEALRYTPAWSGPATFAGGMIVIWDLVGGAPSGAVGAKNSATGNQIGTRLNSLTTVSITPQTSKSCVIFGGINYWHTAYRLQDGTRGEWYTDSSTWQGENGGDVTLDEADQYGHYYPADVSQQTAIWATVPVNNKGVGGWASIAIEIKGPTAAAPQPPEDT